MIESNLPHLTWSVDYRVEIQISIIFLLSDLKYEIFLENSLGGQKTASDGQIPAPAEIALHLI
jgi:hypothetical protein